MEREAVVLGEPLMCRPGKVGSKCLRSDPHSVLLHRQRKARAPENVEEVELGTAASGVEVPAARFEQSPNDGHATTGCRLESFRAHTQSPQRGDTSAQTVVE